MGRENSQGKVYPTRAKVSEARREKGRPRLILIDSDSENPSGSPPRREAGCTSADASERKRIRLDEAESERRTADCPRCDSGAAPGAGALSCEAQQCEEGSELRLRRDGSQVSRNGKRRCKVDSSGSSEAVKCEGENWGCGGMDGGVGGGASRDGSERKRGRAASFDVDEDARVGRRNLRSGGRKAEFGVSRPLDLKVELSDDCLSDAGKECGGGAMVDKKLVRRCIVKKSEFVDRKKQVECFDKKHFWSDKDDRFVDDVSKGSSIVHIDKPIWVQGRGGVLKVSSNNRMKVGEFAAVCYSSGKEKGKGKEHVSVNIPSQKVSMDPVPSAKKRVIERLAASNILPKGRLRSQCVRSDERIKDRRSEVEKKDVSLLTQTKSADVSSIEQEKSKNDCGSELEISLLKQQWGGKNSKKEGRRTEKQLLCDRIRGMLLSTGWKIDYRQRKSRDYKDAVYISPRGIEHWSVTKAYYAFQKQVGDVSVGNVKEEEPSGACGSSSSIFTKIPEEVLSILKRNRINKKEKETVKNKLSGKTKIIKNKKLKERSSVMQENKLIKRRNKENGSIGLKMRGNVGNGEVLTSEDGHLSSTSLDVGGKPCSMFDDPRKNKSRRGLALLARTSNKGADVDADDYVAYPGKRTLLSWLIDSGTVSENEKVQYMNKREKAILKGWITRDGIHCCCCSKVLPVSKFEIHAGSKLCQPFENIYVETGDSLLQCLLDAWDRQGEAETAGFQFVEVADDPNDDTCGICGDGGDLICCDGCPSTFHQSCLNIQMLPPGDWNCFNCMCRFCGVGVGTSQVDVCASSLLTCSQCEGKYHQGCVSEVADGLVNFENSGASFCGVECGKLFSHLQKLLGVKNYLDAGFSWMLVHRFEKYSEKSLLELAQRAEGNAKVAVAAAVMDECFFPITDRRSGINLIQNVLYNRGSNFNRLNYGCFYTVVLERGDEIVSAASIRIRGTRLAEMPFIGTRHMYRRQGMCRQLLNAIEMVLTSLGIEKLIIPAVSELTHTWTQVFGFGSLEESDRQKLSSLNMMVFPGIDMLQKPLLKTDRNAVSDGDVKDIDRKGSGHDTAEVNITSPRASAIGPDELVSENSTSENANNEEKGAATKCCLDIAKVNVTFPRATPVGPDELVSENDTSQNANNGERGAATKNDLDIAEVRDISPGASPVGPDELVFENNTSENADNKERGAASECGLDIAEVNNSSRASPVGPDELVFENNTCENANDGERGTAANCDLDVAEMSNTSLRASPVGPDELLFENDTSYDANDGKRGAATKCGLDMTEVHNTSPRPSPVGPDELVFENNTSENASNGERRAAIKCGLDIAEGSTGKATECFDLRNEFTKAALDVASFVQDVDLAHEEKPKVENLYLVTSAQFTHKSNGDDDACNSDIHASVVNLVRYTESGSKPPDTFSHSVPNFQVSCGSSMHCNSELLPNPQGSNTVVPSFPTSDGIEHDMQLRLKNTDVKVETASDESFIFPPREESLQHTSQFVS